jgi:transcriptional regulator with XRE-family HTH domain
MPEQYMTAYAERILNLRKQSGKSVKEMCDLLGISDMGYFDLELHDDELPTVLSLAQVRCLAAALGVTVPALLSEEGFATSARHIEYEELVEHTKNYMRQARLNQEQLGDHIGWSLDDFFAGEQKMLDAYNLEFMKALCAEISIFWLEAFA